MPTRCCKYHKFAYAYSVGVPFMINSLYGKKIRSSPVLMASDKFRLLVEPIPKSRPPIRKGILYTIGGDRYGMAKVQQKIAQIQHLGFNTGFSALHYFHRPPQNGGTICLYRGCATWRGNCYQVNYHQKNVIVWMNVESFDDRKVYPFTPRTLNNSNIFNRVCSIRMSP